MKLGKAITIQGWNCVTVGQVGTILTVQGWNWAELGKVDTIWAKLALSKSGFGQHFAKWALSGPSWHYPSAEFVQLW